MRGTDGVPRCGSAIWRAPGRKLRFGFWQHLLDLVFCLATGPGGLCCVREQVRGRPMLPVWVGWLAGYLRRGGRWTLGCNLSSRLFGASLGKIAAITGAAGHSGRGLGIRTWHTPQPAHSDGGLSKSSLRRTRGTEQGTGALGERDGPSTRAPRASAAVWCC